MRIKKIPATAMMKPGGKVEIDTMTIQEKDSASNSHLDRLARVQWLVSKHKGLMAFEVEARSKRPKGGNSWYLRQTDQPEQLAEWRPRPRKRRKPILESI